jgi:hypothetical protein
MPCKTIYATNKASDKRQSHLALPFYEKSTTGLKKMDVP